MFSINNKISIRQLKLLLIFDIISIRLIRLPKKSSAYGQNGWQLIIVCTILAIISSWLITKLLHNFKGQTFIDYTSRLASKPAAYILSLIFITKILINTALELRLFTEILKETFLKNTPPYLIIIPMIVLSLYAVTKGLETRARLAEILSLIILIPLIVILVSTVIGIDLSNLRPFYIHKPSVLAYSATFVSFFTNLDLMLFMAPFIRDSAKVNSSILKITLYCGLAMTLMTMTTISRFSAAYTAKELWPVLRVLDTLSLPGAFIERQESIFVSFFIVSEFFIASSGLFFSSMICKDLIKTKTPHIPILLCSIIIIVIASIPMNVNSIYFFMDKTFIYLGSLCIFIIPLLLLALSKLKKIGLSL